MRTLYRTLVPIFLVLIGFVFIEAGIIADYADAKSFKGGRSFKTSPTYKKSPTSTSTAGQRKSGGGFSRGLMGGLLGGALGGMLFGSMFGAGGQGMGILPMLLLGGGAYFLFKRFSGAKRGHPGSADYGGQGQQNYQARSAEQSSFGSGASNGPGQSFTPDIGGNLLDEGLAQIRQYDRGFDASYFQEIASDVFFQVQAGWMRRDLDSYRHLIGDQLAKEYEGHFEKMREKGIINKLESIAIRGIEVVQAGSDGREDFVSVKFTANLLDYNVDDKTGELVDGSMTTPVKFEEDWSWARATGTENWRLEGIH